MQSDEGRERLLEGVVASHRLHVGTLFGWGSGLLLRRFGRSLVTSVGGGSLLILVAHKRGYVTLKWSRILDNLGGHTPMTLTTSTPPPPVTLRKKDKREGWLCSSGGGSFLSESGFRDTHSLSPDNPAWIDLRIPLQFLCLNKFYFKRYRI
jgi:hypothetical protein